MTLRIVVTALALDEQLDRTLLSISRQSLFSSDVRVVVVSPQTETCASLPRWVELLEDSKQGVYAAINKGISHFLNEPTSQSDAGPILFLSSGAEYLDDNSLEKLVGPLLESQDPILVAGGWEQIIDRQGESKLHSFPRFAKWLHFTGKVPINIEAMTFNPWCVRSSPLFDESYRIGSDVDLTIRLLQEMPVKFLNVGVVLLPIPGLSAIHSGLGDAEKREILKKHRHFFQSSPLYLAAAVSVFSSAKIASAKDYLAKFLSLRN